MNKCDIESTLTHAYEQITELERQAKTGPINKVILKNVLENLRSVLEYTAHDIANKVRVKYKKYPDKIYFPYGQRKNHFERSISQNVPYLKNDFPDIYDLIESCQPFICGNNWLVDLCNLTNEAKHKQLSKTEENKNVAISRPGVLHIQGASNVSIQGNYVNGKPMDDIEVDGKGNVSIRRNSNDIEVTTTNCIKFEGKQIEVVPFLQACHRKIECVCDEIYKLL